MIEIETQGTLVSGSADALLRRLLRVGAQGELHLKVGDQEAKVLLKPGRIVSVECGSLRGDEALLRIGAFAEGDWSLDAAGEPQEADLDDGTLEALGQLDRQLARWSRYVRRIGGLDQVLRPDAAALAGSSLPSELRPFASAFDGQMTVADRVIGSRMNDLTALRLTSKLVEQGMLQAAPLRAEPAGNEEAAAATWLADNSGVFESPLLDSREEMVSEHFGAPTELPGDADSLRSKLEAETAAKAEAEAAAKAEAEAAAKAEAEAAAKAEAEAAAKAEAEAAAKAEAEAAAKAEAEAAAKAEAVAAAKAEAEAAAKAEAEATAKAEAEAAAKAEAEAAAKAEAEAAAKAEGEAAAKAEAEAAAKAEAEKKAKAETAAKAEKKAKAEAEEEAKARDAFVRPTTSKAKILAEAGEPSGEIPALDAWDGEDEWFNPGTTPDPHDFEIDYKKGSRAPLVIAFVGLLGVGAYLFMNSSAPSAAFMIDQQLEELDKLLDDRSCANAKAKYAFIEKKAVKTAHKAALQKRDGKLATCVKQEQRMLQEKGLGGTISVTGGEFAVETSQDMAARAIAAAQGDTAIAPDQTARLTTQDRKNFGRFVEYGERLSIRLDDVRRTKPGDDGTFSVAVRITFKARQDTQFEAVSMKLRDNADGKGDPRWWSSAPSDAVVPMFGDGKLNKGRSHSGWVTFHGLDEKVRWPSLDYHPMWEPAGFAAGLADDLTADLTTIAVSKDEAQAAVDADPEAPAEDAGAAVEPKLELPAETPALAAPSKKEEAKPALMAPSKPEKAAPKKSAPVVAKKSSTPRVTKKTTLPPRVVSKDPLVKARSWVKKRNARKARSAAEAVLKRDPGNGEAHYIVGWANVQLGDFAGARRSLSKATSLGAPPDAWYNLGLAYQMLGDDQKAVSALKRFVTLAPGHRHAAMARETIDALQ